ncbi:MAG: hypothetical protein HY897_18985 [Deltaproteobacteria bacterium]|nr:hypothetical protein [Deltaproteobacteria bacterium]
MATWGLVHGDERPISGDRGSGAIMFSGCPLRCPSCHNPEMVAAGVRVTPNRLAAMAWDLRKRGAENLQLLSPTVHIPALARVLRHLRGCGFDIPVVFKSSGYESVNELRKFEGLVDVYLPDVKFGPRSRWAESAGAADYFDEMRRAVEEMYRQTGPLALSPRGTAVRGVLVRCVPAPLPSRERGTIERFLRTLPKGIHVSHTAVFDRLG